MGLSDVFEKRPDLLDDEKKLKGVFADFYAGDEAKVRRMMKAYEIGVLDSLLEGKTTDFDQKKLIDKLVNLHDMQEQRATEAISEWFMLCPPRVIIAYQEYLKEKLNAAEIAKAKEEKAAKENIRTGKEKSSNLDKVIGNQNVDYENYDRHMNIDLERGPALW